MRFLTLLSITAALCACRSDRHDYYYEDETPDQMPGALAQTTPRAQEAAVAKTTSESVTNDGPALRSSAQDSEFVKAATQGGLFEVESSRLALEKAVSEHVRQFARMMVEDHGRANERLGVIVDKKGWTAPTDAGAQYARQLEELRLLDGKDFERRFVAMQIAAHDDAIALFQRGSDHCDDPDLRAFAASTLPTLREHRRHLDDEPL